MLPNTRPILAAVAEAFGVRLTDLTGPARQRHIAEARQAAAWVLRRACPALSLASIGQVLGGRDHTTIIYAIERIDMRRRDDPELAALLARLLHQLSGTAPTLPASPPDPALGWWVAQGRAEWFVAAA